MNEPSNIQELCSTGEIGIPISPNQYGKEVAEEFMLNINSNSWNVAALKFDIEDIVKYEEYTRLHKDKVDVVLRNMMLLDDRMQDEEWLYVPQEMASIYMTYYSYLTSMRTLGKNDFSNYNYRLYRKIEEFIND